MHEHRPVFLLPHGVPYFNDKVGTDTDDVAVKRGVVQFAERKPVADLGHSSVDHDPG
jgi:hypothetical protein